MGNRPLKNGEVYVDVNVSNQGTHNLTISDEDTGERIAGPKAWGGSRTVHSFIVKAADLVRVAQEYGKGVEHD